MGCSEALEAARITCNKYMNKHNGKACRVRIGTQLISVRTTNNNVPHVLQAMRRARMKFSGRQLVKISSKCGFTRFTKEELESLKAEGRLQTEGSHVHDRGTKGSLANHPDFQE